MKTSDKPSLDTTRLPFAYALRHGVLLEVDEKGMRLCSRADAAFSIITEVRRHCGARVHIQVLDNETFNRRLATHYDETLDVAKGAPDGPGEQFDDGLDLVRLAEQLPSATDLKEQRDDASIIRLINTILSEAMNARASDVHLEVFEKYLSVRLRVDGILREVLRPPREIATLLISRIRGMTKLDATEKHLPQHGRIALRIAGQEVDVRVSILPTARGECVIMRLPAKESDNLDLSHLGMSAHIRQQFESGLRKPHGLLLVTGPSGSGKNTTLRAGLTHLNSTKRSILTAVDPVRYYINGVDQIQANAQLGMAIARSLKTILKQDPDVVMIREIHDSETADIAVQASLTGHLVLSSLHAYSAIGGVSRLLDLGVKQFQLRTSLLGVLSQRLVRMLCPSCKRAQLADTTACAKLGVSTDPPPLIYSPGGCAKCRHTGYHGREGIYELILFDDAIRQLIHKGASELELLQYARQSNPSLLNDGQRKVLLGLTSLEELLRVTSEV